MLPLPLVVALHVHEVSAIVVLTVGVVAAGLALVGYRSYERSRNRSLVFVVGAFGVLAGKGFIGSVAIYTRSVPHEHLELILSFADLAVVGLLATPFVLTKRRNAR